MQTTIAYQKIEELAKTYTETSNRQVLTQLRQTVTSLLRKNACTRTMVLDIFNKVQLNEKVVGL